MSLKIKDALGITKLLDSFVWDGLEHVKSISISDSHAHTHTGDQWATAIGAPLGNAEWAAVTFETGSKEVEFNFVADIALSATYEFIEGATANSGVVVAPYNKNFTSEFSGNTQECTVTVTGTSVGGSSLTGGTVVLGPVSIGSSNKVGGGAENIFIFEANTTYTLRLTSTAASNNAHVGLEWNERD
jgi:hypothetical protein